MKEIVVLLPGLGSPAWSMAYVASQLRRQGFDAVVIGYPSRGSTIEDMAEHVRSRLPDADKIHFVCHSLGGLVARRIVAAASPDDRFGRVVMIGTPLLGNRLAGRLAGTFMGKLYFGKVWPDLTPEACAVNHEAIAGIDIGMIAGSVPGGRLLCRRETDGVVSVDATRGEGLTDHTTVPASHALLLLNRRVGRLAGEFLRRGIFPALG